MKANLIKLSLIGVVSAFNTSALANPNSDETQEEQEAIIYAEIGPRICPDEPFCPPVIYLEEDEQ